MILTPLTLKDCAHAAALHQATFYKGWTEKDFQDFLQDPLVFSLKIDDFCGYILWREIESEAEILTLVVAPSYQQRGRGALLLEALFEQLIKKGVTKLFLEVAEDNKSAQSFYIKNGFSLLGIRPDYYKRSENKYVNALNFVKHIEETK